MSRKLPPRDLAEAILIEQRGCCLYCLLPLDGWIYLGVNSIDLTLNWDHMKPYVYLQDNPDDNWAAACQICNSIKNDLHFVTLEEARKHIRERRDELGYKTIKPHWHDQLEEEAAEEERNMTSARMVGEYDGDLEIVQSPLRMDLDLLLKHIEKRHNQQFGDSQRKRATSHRWHRNRHSIEARQGITNHKHEEARCDVCSRTLYLSTVTPRKLWPNGKIYCSISCGREETGQQRISTRLRDDADENAPYGYHADGLPRRSNGGRRRKSQA